MDDFVITLPLHNSVFSYIGEGDSSGYMEQAEITICWTFTTTGMLGAARHDKNTITSHLNLLRILLF